MGNENWMIYGAYGYTGALVAEEAIRRGHRPVLAGRSAEKLAPLAERLGLDSVVLDLTDEERLSRVLQDFDLVFHAAGPFVYTSAPMVRACLKAGANYLDVTGEVKVFEEILSQDQQARERGIALIPGVGFDVVATDCLARHVAEQIAHPPRLDIATSITSNVSPGTAKTMLNALPMGTLARRQGRLVRISVRQGMKRTRFLDREQAVLPVSLADIASAYRTTGAPDITTYTAFPERTAALFRRAEPVFRRVFAVGWLRRMAQRWIERSVRGPDEHMRQTERSQVWVRARNDAGVEKQAWLETSEAYQFTAVAGVRCVEKVLADPPQGAMTPALAFGADFVLEIPGTRHEDDL